MSGWLLVAVAFLVLASPRARLRPRLPRRRGPDDVDPVEVAQLLAVALASGLPLGGSFVAVGRLLNGARRDAIEELVARGRARGLTRALIETEGPLADVAHRLARAQVSGAPIGPALDAYIDSALDARRAAAVEAARVLGVRLLLPVTLLLLPGFIALVVGPTVLDFLFDLGPGVRP